MPTSSVGKWKGIAIGLALSLGFAGAARNAAARDGDDPAGAGGGTSASSSAKADADNGNAADPNSPILLELRELEKTVAAQTKRFDEHSKELDGERAALHDELARIANLEAAVGVTPEKPAAADSSSVAVLVSGPAATDQTSQTQTPQDLSNRISNIEDRLKNFGPFSFSGDFRLRDEPFFGGPSSQSLDQNRERFRLRLNLTAKLNDDFGGGFSLASGDINDPTSTNQTVTGFYTRKAIAIDKAYVDYTPHYFHNLTLIGGKFGYPWYNTELTWDKDLNPEGAAETLAFNTSTPVLKKIALVGFELPFAQVAGVSTTNQSSVESVVYGGQLQTTWQVAKWLKFGAFTGFYNYHNADPIAIALAKASAKNPQTPLTGLLPLGTGNTVQNSIVTTASTNEVTIAGTSYPTGVTTVTNAQFASKFGLFDSLARFDINTPSDKWPVALIGDYVQNTEACANMNNISAAPANTASVHYSQSTNFPCDPNQRRGYWGEVQVGRGQKRGDWQFDYTRMFIEREAVLSNFNYSDIRQGSNVTEHRAMVIYQVHRNVQTSFTALIGRPLNFGSTAPAQDWLKRLQFDLIYSF
ncbi:MAG: putative porin [Candidatus Acidiferrales bacterium]